MCTPTQPRHLTLGHPLPPPPPSTPLQTTTTTTKNKQTTPPPPPSTDATSRWRSPTIKSALLWPPAVYSDRRFAAENTWCWAMLGSLSQVRSDGVCGDGAYSLGIAVVDVVDGGGGDVSAPPPPHPTPLLAEYPAGSRLPVVQTCCFVCLFVCFLNGPVIVDVADGDGGGDDFSFAC